ncbi:hypothetical protein F4777DRAFT_568567 [Nemania sp. FL0916]|nr:hypothetical protein F4777DRAFT_568567 [Nemania sp. FL0916]
MAPLCKFWQNGNCRNGALCRFEHPGANSSSNPFSAAGGGGNRFSALDNNASTRPQDGANPYKVTKDGIRGDLTEERPSWVLSCYGPGKDAPEQVFGGYPREQSLEEIMVHIRGSANKQQALDEVGVLRSQAEQQIQAALRNLDGAVSFVLAADNNHPNRNDVCKQNTIQGGTNGVFLSKAGSAEDPSTTNTGANQNPFSTTTTTTPANPFGGGNGGTPAFGQPSALGQKPNPFSTAPTPQFGQPSQMGHTAPAFGQPSQMGASAPAFGQPSQMGASAPAFGQPSQMGAAAPAFGQPSTLGPKPSPFSAPASSGASPFARVGQPAFGQPSQMGQSANPFGAPTAPAAAPAANPFSQTNSAASGASPFSQLGGQGASSNTSPFGQPAAAAQNPFSQASESKDLSMDTSGPAPNNPFGQPSAANNNNNNNNNSPFSAPTNPLSQSVAPNPFSTVTNNASQPRAHPLSNVLSQNQTSSTQPGANNGGNKPGPYPPGSTKQHPPPESYISKSMNGQLTNFKGQPVVYRFKVNDKYQDQPPPAPGVVEKPAPGFLNRDGSWTKILFPDGPPAYNRDTEPDAREYDDNVRAIYAKMAARGRFEGDVPEVPPMREDCVWLV